MNIYSTPKSKYERWYYNIIKNAKCQIRFRNDGYYYENHHIIPSSLGGLDSPENLVLLTAREHLICHWLLCKFTSGENKAKMVYAFAMMCNVKNHHQKRYVARSVMYEASKRFRSEAGVSKETRIKQSKSQTGKTIPLETRTKISETSKGRAKSKEHKEKLSKSLKGKKKSPEHIEKISIARKGAKWTSEQKENLKRDRPNLGENNPIFSGWYETPWGVYPTPKLASSNSPFPITENAIRKYCKYNNTKTITKNHPVNKDYIGKTPQEVGFGFIPSE